MTFVDKSTDPNGLADIDYRQWNISTEPAAPWVINDTTFARGLAPGGPYVVTLAVRDKGGLTSTATGTINVAGVAPTISDVLPHGLKASPNDQSVLFVGTGFQVGLTMSVGLPGGGSATLAGAQIRNVGPTSIGALVTFGSPGTYTFEVINPDGVTSLPFAVAVGARSIPTLSTLSNTGQAAEGLVDPNYILLRGPTCQADSCPVFSEANLEELAVAGANTAASKWITPVSGFESSEPPGQYVYRLTFTVAEAEAATAIITGRWAADDIGIDILLNGESTGSQTSQVFAFSQFVIATGFKSGVNTLDFVVVNQDCGQCRLNPVALRVELAGRATTATSVQR